MTANTVVANAVKALINSTVAANRVTDADFKTDPKDPYGHTIFRGKRMTLAQAAWMVTLETPPDELKRDSPNLFPYVVRKPDYKKMWSKELASMGINSEGPVAQNAIMTHDDEMAIRDDANKIEQKCREALAKVQVCEPLLDSIIQRSQKSGESRAVSVAKQLKRLLMQAEGDLDQIVSTKIVHFFS